MDGEGGAPRSNTAARAKASRGWGTRRTGLLPLWDHHLRPQTRTAAAEDASAAAKETSSSAKTRHPGPAAAMLETPVMMRVRQAAIDLRPEPLQPVDSV